MPLQIRTARLRASVQKNRPSFPPAYPSRASYHPPLSLFFSSTSSAFVWSSSTRYPRATLPFPIPETVQSHRRVVSSRKRKNGEKGEREGNAVTRENPLRNVFGPCTARYYLQSRACVRYTCKREERERRKRGTVDTKSRGFESTRYENAYGCRRKQRSERD